MPPVSRPLERLGLDLTDLIAGDQSARYVLTVIDHYSRYVRFYPLRNKQTENVTKALEQYFADFGTPLSLVLDNGGEFSSRHFKEFCRTRHIGLHYVTPYHPQGNAITERVHRTLKSVLTALCKGYPKKWPHYLKTCQTVLNTSVHTSTNTTPYFAFFGRHPSRNFNVPLPDIQGTEDEVKVAHRVILDTQRKMVRRYRGVANRRLKNRAVGEGSLVWVRNETPVLGTCKKLNLKWKGPYKVVEVIRGGSAYTVADLFTGHTLRRAAEKVKKYCGRDEWLLKQHEEEARRDQGLEEAPERRQRNPPRRYIEEC